MATSVHLDSSAAQAIAQLKYHSNEDWSSSAQRILQIHNGIYYVWSHKDSNVLAVCCTTKEHFTLIPTDTPLFHVDQLQVSPNGRWLCLSGSNGLTIVDLPKRLGRQGRFVGSEGGEKELLCRSYPIAQRFFMGQPKVVVQKVVWHPGSLYDNYLVVLTSDNFLRIYDLENLDEGSIKAEQKISLAPNSGGESSNRDETESKPFGDATLSVKASLGETAVDFAFAPPLPADDFSEENPIFHLFPIFVLHGNGNVFCLLTGLGSHAPKTNRIIGPLAMYPDAEDNYGLDSCSILCLHPTISSPPVLIIATNGGTLYHCVVLNQTEDETDKEEDAKSDWSSSAFGRNPDESRTPELSLYVFESVELELALTSDEGDGKSPFDYPILLLSDPSTPARYFCSHKAGIHCVGLPMVSQLSEMAQREETSYEILTEQSSYVEHLVCTQMSSTSLPAPILGLTIAFPPSALVFLMNDYRVETLLLSAPYFIEPLPLLSSGTLDLLSSPLRKNQGKEPFDKHISKLLQKTTSQPLMKGATGAQLSNVECLKILTRSTKILREEYIARLENVRKELERRTEQLESRKRNQQVSLAKLMEEKAKLREGASKLSERYEDIKDNAERLSNRIQRVLQFIQNQQPSNSDAEFRMQRQLKNHEVKLRDLQNALEQIRSKEKYQFRQIWQSKQNIMQHRLTGSPGGRLSDDQLSGIKAMLKQDEEDIYELKQELKIAQSCLEC